LSTKKRGMKKVLEDTLLAAAPVSTFIVAYRSTTAPPTTITDKEEREMEKTTRKTPRLDFWMTDPPRSSSKDKSRAKDRR
jgi:hypothetical protein